MTLLAAPSSSAQFGEEVLWWQALLQTWSSSGQLEAAALEALTPEAGSAGSGAFAGQIQALVSQWQAGNFTTAPTIAFLSEEEIGGAKAAYASSTGTIYFNASWWENASEKEKAILLAEEAGHFLEDSTGLKDQTGDEGALFAAALFEQALTDEELSLIHI